MDFAPLDDLTFPQAVDGQDVYFGVATRNGGGSKDHIIEIPGVWVDIDFKDIPKKEAHKRITEFPLKPTIAVDSGGGYHLYWRLKEPASKADIAHIEALNKRLVAYLNGDINACDAARILRFPRHKEL